MLRIIVEKNLPLDLQTLTEEAVRLYGSKLTNAKVVDEVVEFMLGRFRAWYQEEGHAVDTIQAVLARRPTKPADFDARVKAVSHFRTLEAAAALAAANKRVSNILAKSTETLNDSVRASVLKDAAEIQLATHLVVLRDKLQPYFAAGNYRGSAGGAGCAARAGGCVLRQRDGNGGRCGSTREPPDAAEQAA